MMRRTYDIIVVGSGAAGLTLALSLADHGRIAVLSKGPVSAGATNQAQGGIAAVFEADDSTQSHIDDTLIAGAGLCDEKTVRFVVERGRDAVEDLASHGVSFDKDKGREEDGFGFHLTREGGHSHRRVIHAADATGRAVQKSLSDRVDEEPNIDVFSHHIAVDIITDRHLHNPTGYNERAHGVYVLNTRTGHVQGLTARATVLATGGASRVYLYSSNPDGTTGDGIAMAWRAGCRVSGMEFNQFHPTCLYHPDAKSFLVTEAMRGEGAVLTLKNGERFMPRFDKRGELAPRDIVARAIDHEMKRLGEPCVWLDISHRDPDFIISHFPNIYRKCRELGMDITNEPIPVVPAAHYTCGGIITDIHGRTDLDGLYAIGECASTGLHGANRMASNSLLECLVFGRAAADHIIEQLPALPQPPVAHDWDESKVTDSDEEVVVSHNWNELRRFMWDYVGIVRTNKRLKRAKSRIDLLMSEIQEYYGNFRVTSDLLELRNLVTVADLIVRSSINRKESRGLHFTSDYPDMDPKEKAGVLTPYDRAVAERVE